MEISSAAPSPPTWNLNDPKAITKPSVLAEADPIKLAIGSMVVVAGESMANTEVVGDAMSMLVDAVALPMVGDAVSMSMADEAMSMSMADEAMSMADKAMLMSMADKAMSMADEVMSMADEAMSMSMAVGDAESTAVAGDEPSILVDASRLAMVGEGAGESVDPDPIIPTVGAN
jgi:hypothetical protein